MIKNWEPVVFPLDENPSGVRIDLAYLPVDLSRIDIKNIVNLDVWNDVLNEHDRNRLRRFLPRFSEPTSTTAPEAPPSVSSPEADTVNMLLSHQIMNHESPLDVRDACYRCYTLDISKKVTAR